MPDIAPDFQELLPHRTALLNEPYDGPIYWLWVFDPESGHVTIHHNEDSSRAEAKTHDEVAPEVTHPGRLNGYAYKIQGGYRITTDDHKKLEDPFVVKQVIAALKGEQPHKPLPHIRNHGMPTDVPQREGDYL